LAQAALGIKSREPYCHSLFTAMTHSVSAALFCATLVAGAVGLGQISVLKRDVSVHDQAASSCACLDWSDAYTVFGAKCGEGHELDLALAEGLSGLDAAKLPQLSFELCEQYFGNLPKDNFCMKTRFDAEDESWCYVKPECAVGEQSQGSGPLKTKLCSAGQDRILGEMKFEDFVAQADELKLEKGLMAQFAYPTFQGAKLEDVQSFWGLAPGSDAVPMTEELRQRLQEVKDSGKTTFFTSRSGHPPFGVAEGEKFYWINYSKTNTLYTIQGTQWDHKEKMNSWACVAGCEKVKTVF